jgi:putative polyketide hydroxylase
MPQVLIVGGSLVGLSAAMFLRVHGADVLLVERHPGTSIHPRTPGYNARTMELFRAAGVEKAVREAGPWDVTESGLLWAESLTGPRHQWLAPPNLETSSSELSPCEDVVLTQDVIEPVLRAHVESLGAELRFGTVLTSFEQDRDGVRAVLADRDTGRVTTVRADYLLAADGAASSVRESLGIGRAGVGVLDHVVGIMVRADLGDALRERRFAIAQITNPGFEGMVRVVGDRLALHVTYRPEEGESAADFTGERCVELARAAAGVPDLDVEPLGVLPWQSTAAVATTFSLGRVFLAGDAAHVMPPSGAYGANTGIQDAANLAWKLAYVLDGRAEPSLLDSYDAERRPVAEFTVEQALATGREWFGADLAPGVELVDAAVVKFGYGYPPASLVGDPRTPSYAPGTRLPHVWLEPERSTVDLWASGFALVTGPDGDAWEQAAEGLTSAPAAGLTAAPTTELAVGRLDALASGAALLVRPDGFIAWRADDLPTDPAEALRQALRDALR